MPEPDVRPGGRNYRPVPNRRRPIIRVLIPIFAFLSLIAIVTGLCVFLIDRKTDPITPLVTAPVPTKESPPLAIAKSDSEDLPNKLVSSETAPETPDAVAAPAGPDLLAASDWSYEVLEQFLAAKTFEERLPLIETKSDPSGFADTLLAKPLPKAVRYAIEMQNQEPIENLIDTYYSVDFDAGNGSLNPQTVLVRIRGKAEPKVVVQPLLDLFGGGLEKYASAPDDSPAYFQVIASSVAQCYNLKVPNRQKKWTVKLMARDNTKPIAEAYFGKHSRIAEMLSDDDSGFRYGQAQPCTILLRWNTEEDPENPYLEATNISDLNWNP